jgi:hypothetical protein
MLAAALCQNAPSDRPLKHPDGPRLEDELDGIACLDDSELEAARRAKKTFDGFVNSLAEACKKFDDADFGDSQVGFDGEEDAREYSLAIYPSMSCRGKMTLVSQKIQYPGFEGKSVRVPTLYVVATCVLSGVELSRPDMFKNDSRCRVF